MILLSALLLIIFLVIEAEMSYRRTIKHLWIQGGISALVYLPLFVKSYLSSGFLINQLYLLIYLYMIVQFVIFYNKRLVFQRIQKDENASELKEFRLKLESLLEKENSLKNDIKKLNENLEQSSSMYNASLKMSSTLDFKENMHAFADTLGKINGFNKLYIILKVASEKEEKTEEVAAYRLLASNNEIEKYPLGHPEEVIFSRSAGEKKISLVSDCLNFGLLPGTLDINDKQPALFVPLYFQEEFSGVLVYFNNYYNETQYIDHIEILGLHFSMEIHKALLYEKIKRLSTIDALTGVYLKRHFIPLFEDEVKRHNEHNMHMAVIMVDIDQFKQINDRYGHLTGDLVISQITSAIRAKSREEDLIGRFGGDEFVVVLPRISREQAYNITLRMHEAIRNIKFNEKTNDEFSVTVSIGVVMYPEDGNNLETLLELADSA
ncbi:MAG: diguanylate cyclase and metal dependent phosphohydrolase, partial [uncultured bacterium]